MSNSYEIQQDSRKKTNQSCEDEYKYTHRDKAVSSQSKSPKQGKLSTIDHEISSEEDDEYEYQENNLSTTSRNSSNHYVEKIDKLTPDEIDKINRLCNLLPKNIKVESTSFELIYPYWDILLSKKCYATEPRGDQFIYKDLLKIFELKDLVEAVEALELFPYYNYYKDAYDQLKAKPNRINSWKLSSQQLLLAYDIRVSILNRASYGVFLIYESEFFAVQNAFGGKRWSAVKGHGTSDLPWEIARKELKEEVLRVSNTNSPALPYDLDENKEDYQRLEYVECLFSSTDKKQNNRVIGLFILRLRKHIEFIPRDENEVLACCWNPISKEYNESKFYTLVPFIKYVKDKYFSC